MRNEAASNLTTILAELAEVNYYNNSQNIVRVKIGDTDEMVKYFDIPLVFTGEFPNPEQHYVVMIVDDSIISELKYAILPGDDEIDLPPGYYGDNLNQILTPGQAWLINKKIKQNTTNLNVGDINNFNSDANLSSDEELIRYSFSPPLNKDYTTTEDQYVGDKNDDSIGVFITDNSVLLKSAAGSIMLGPDGISFGGKQVATATVSGNGIMKKNPIGTIMPETMMTFLASIQYIPNMDYILAVGNTVNRTVHTSIAIKNVIDIASSV